jgi:hypothetical protein
LIVADAFSLFHVDDCMYVLAADAEAARAHVRQECGADCGESVKEVSLDIPATTADVDEGQKATPETMTTARALAQEHLRHGGTLPYTLLFDAGL